MPTNRSRRTSTATSSLVEDKYRTTKVVTYALLAIFLVSVVALFIISWVLIPGCKADDDARDIYQGWFELLKSALVLIGTALTTIIGYYFGQRESESARETATKATNEAQAADEDKAKLLRLVDDLTTSLGPQGGSSELFDPSRVPFKADPRTHDRCDLLFRRHAVQAQRVHRGRRTRGPDPP